MALMIRELIGGVPRTVNRTPFELAESMTVSEGLSSEANQIDPDSLMVDIEGIHAHPHATRNYTRYMPQCLKNSCPSWTKPYRRPLIKHHNEENGDTIGRVCDVKYKTTGTLSGTPALVFTVNVPQSEAKKDIQNGLLDTVSIGVIAHDVRCSICGKQIELDDNGEIVSCEHKRGEVYGKETAYWDIYSMEAKELSYVNVPADMYAKNLRCYPATKSTSKQTAGIQEGYDANLQRKGDSNMPTDDNKDLAKELSEAKEMIADLTKQVKELNSAKTALEAENKSLLDSKEALEADKKALEESKASLEAQASEDKSMKEGMQAEIADAKKAMRESMIGQFQLMRKILGKNEIGEESMKTRTEDSIKDSIADMKEEIAAMKKPEVTEGANDNKNQLPEQGSVTGQGLVEDVNVKKQPHTEDIDLNAGLQNLFSSVIGARN